MKGFWFSLILCLTISSVFGCTCLIPTGGPKVFYDNNFKRADFVLKAAVLNIKEVDGVRLITLKVESQYKGKRIPKRVVINTAAQSGVCGISPNLNRKWLIFGSLKNNQLWTDECTASVSIDQRDWTNDWWGKKTKAKAKYALSYLNGKKTI